MPDTPTASFLARVRALMDQLPPTERRLGAFILDFPGELASYSASELAGLVKAGETVVTTGVFKLRNGTAVTVDNSLSPDFKLDPKPNDS